MEFLYITIVVFSFFFTFTKSEEFYCQEVQETICKSKNNYNEELIQTCLEDNRYWKNYDKNKLDFLVNPFSDFLLTLEPLGKSKNKSTIVRVAITQFQPKKELSCKSNFEMQINQTFRNGK